MYLADRIVFIFANASMENNGGYCLINKNFLCLAIGIWYDASVIFFKERSL